MLIQNIKKIFNIFSFILIFTTQSSFAGEAYPHEVMFINCTRGIINATNAHTQPYKFSMNPLIFATNGFSPPYSFVIPTDTIYAHPISVYINWFSDNKMNIFLSGAIDTQIEVTLLEGKYINFKTDPRYVRYLGSSENWVPGRGNRTILGLGCSEYGSKSAAMNIQNIKASIVTKADK